jgi:hypothetical protein
MARIIRPGVVLALAFCMLFPLAQTALAQVVFGISNISPGSAIRGGSDFIITVNGTGLSGATAGSFILWGTVALPATVLSSTQATASVPAANIALPGSIAISFQKRYATNISTSNSITFWILAPLDSIAPAFATVGDPGFTLTLNGDFSRMIRPSVQWNGNNRPTATVSTSQLTATILAADIAAAGTVDVRVTSLTASINTNAIPFTIDPPLSITDTNPRTIMVGSPSFVLTVTGTGFRFEYGSRLLWNGVERPTTIVSPTQLLAVIPSSDVASMGTAGLTVFNQNQKRTSNAVTFRITASSPVLDSLTPTSAVVGTAGFTLTVNGRNFLPSSQTTNASIPGSIVQWNGANRPTTFVNSNRVTASIPASDIAVTGVASIAVSNESQGGGVPTALPFSINNPIPSITVLSPPRVSVGSNSINLIVSGRNFVSGSVVRFRGAFRLGRRRSGQPRQVRRIRR